MKSPIIQNVILLLVCTTIASTALVNAKCCGRPSKPVLSKPVSSKPVSVVEQIKEKITRILGGKQDDIVINESNDVVEREEQCSNSQCIHDEIARDVVLLNEQSNEVVDCVEEDKEDSEIITKTLSIAEVIAVVNTLITDAMNAEEIKIEQSIIAKEDASDQEEVTIVEDII